MAERSGRLVDKLVISPAPHLGVRSSAAEMSWLVSFSLLPAAAWGFVLFGTQALGVLAVSIGTALVAELLAAALARRFTLGDGSAFLTGLLVGLLMPAGVPLYVPCAASAFGILVVKQSFGGLGRNWMNPALGGVAFALLSWGSAMTQWVAPGISDGGSVPPLVALRAVGTVSAAAGKGPLGILASVGYSFSSLDASVVSWINAHVLSVVGLSLPAGVFDVLIGNVAGRIGEVSVPLLLLGAAFLFRRKIIRWQIPVAFLVAFALPAWVFGGLSTGQGWLAGGPLFQLFSGSLVLGAFFMAGDPVTSPLTTAAGLIYGALIGLLAFFLRFYGSLGDGVVLAMLLGNCAVPLLDKAMQRKQTRSRAEAAG